VGAEEHPHPFPDDPVLAEAARALEDARLTGEVLDAGWRLRYVSSELRNLVGTDDDERLGYGLQALTRATRMPDVWRLDEESRAQWWRREVPLMRHDTARDPAIAAELGPLREYFEQFAPQRPPIAWAGSFVTTFPDGVAAVVGRLVVRLAGPDGFTGMIGLYVGGGLRGSVQAMLSRGDDRMFERMATLTEPARRPAAVLFCDLEDSGVHSRKLSSTAYFAMIRDLTTAIDGAVIECGGIVGKHVGDGVSAFFLAEQAGGEGAAARGAIEAARRIQRHVGGLRMESGATRVNIGVHWGATLVIGQIVTGGRLEVTALGDEVNQAARIQEVCRGGATLVSKDVVERLDLAAAEALGIDPDRVAYEILAELPGASDKARRDAGGVAVTALGAPP
jgi:class 3 adenylate cyclase